MTGGKMTQKSKSSLLALVIHFASGLTIAILGAVLIYILPEAKQGAITTAIYTGSPGWAVVLIGAIYATISGVKALVRLVKKST